MRHRFTLTFPRVLWCCFFCGAAAGTVAANCLSAELPGQLGAFALAYRSGAELSLRQRQKLWISVARQRGAEFGLAALVGMAPFAAAGFSIIAFLGGLYCGLLITVLTLEKGILGLPLFLLFQFPQGIFYLPVWLAMAVRAEDGLAGVKLRSWAALAFFAGLGMLFEAFVNPSFLCF